MSNFIDPVSQAPAAQVPTAAQVPANATAAAAAGDQNLVKINSMGDLKEKAPDVYKAMMQGIAMHIINEMKDANERLKKIIKESGKHR